MFIVSCSGGLLKSRQTDVQINLRQYIVRCRWVDVAIVSGARAIGLPLVT